MPYVHIKSDRAFSLNMGSDAPVDVRIEYDDAGRVVDMNILSKPQPETAEVSGKSVRHDIAVRRAKETAQDADDAALVSAHGEVVWKAKEMDHVRWHAAIVAGHPCCITEHKTGGVKWEIEPEHYGHPLTWDAPDLETAKIRAAAAALREPCKRWRVTLPPQRRIGRRIEGGEVEVWAVSAEGALYRAAQALGAGSIGGGSIEGEAVEVAG